MIITVTMNPAIDKTVELEHFEHGGLNRLKNITLDAGGKGINVSRTMKELGGETIACGFVAGDSGQTILRILKKQGIPADFVEVDGETRTNMKVVEPDGTVTELNEPGPTVSENKLDELIEKLLGYANEEALFILAGSIPSGVSKTVYRRIITAVKERGAKVFLDADGELFVNSLEAKPNMIKPNRVELEEYVKADHRLDEEELIRAAKQFVDQGIELIAVSMGSEGAMFLQGQMVLRCPALAVKPHSTVGAGDAMVAALAYGISRNMTLQECAILGMATSAGAVTTKGTKPPSRELVEKLMKKTKVDFCYNEVQ